jgi:hypothetical protein
MKKFLKTLILAVVLVSMTGCAAFESLFGEAKEKLVGVGFTIETYDNYGELTMTTVGENISLAGNRTKELIVTDSGYGHKYELSSVITITIDGKEMESCGDTLIFAEKGLEKIVDFTNPHEIISTNPENEGTFTSYVANRYRNLFGKSRVVIIKSQMGQPLCAYQGDEVYWEVCERLPKTTRLFIDGKAMYIHRANFQIIDASLLD